MADVLLEGHISVEAALRGGARPVHEVLAVNPGDRRLARVRRLAAERDVPISRVDADELAAMVEGRSHGGVVAHAGARRYLTVTELLAAAGPSPLIVMLDGIEDPYNFGAAVRALYAAGIAGLILRPRRWENAAGLVARASAGASELLPTATAETADDAAATCREAGLRIACASSDAGARSIYQADLCEPLFLLIGGERRGITRSFRARADLLLRIPYARSDARPLGVAAAASVIGFEALRQRTAAGG